MNLLKQTRPGGGSSPEPCVTPYLDVMVDARFYRGTRQRPER
jgi:hypothetical protein